MNWQPIETAPKNEVALFTNGKQTGEGVMMGFGDVHGTRIGLFSPRPTHWMPLPPLPTTQPQAKRELVTVEAVSGKEGIALYVDDFRVAGPKPLGGGNVIHRWSVERSLLAGHDLTKVAVVDKSVIEEVKHALKDAIIGLQGHRAYTPILERVRAALAKLNAGGDA